VFLIQSKFGGWISFEVKKIVLFSKFSLNLCKLFLINNAIFSARFYNRSFISQLSKQNKSTLHV